MAYTVAMNWTKIIEDLRAWGLSETDIAELAHTTQPTINRIKRRRQRVEWEMGERLLTLHRICAAIQTIKKAA